MISPLFCPSEFIRKEHRSLRGSGVLAIGVPSLYLSAKILKHMIFYYDFYQWNILKRNFEPECITNHKTLWVSKVLKYPKKCLEAGQKCAARWAELAVQFCRYSKSHRENSISFIFLESPHQVDMKNIQPVNLQPLF